MGSDLISIQTTDGPTSTSTAVGSNLLLPNRATMDRFAHFPEEVYDITPESHLVRFVKALIGDSGAGQLRKRFLTSRLQQTIQGSHFYDLDRFYGALFGVKRSQDETLDIDPYTEPATSEQWTVQHAKDGSYRSRVTQFAKALSFGATPTGMELIAEALLSVDCDVFESYVQADGSYQTYAELEEQYGSGRSGVYFDGASTSDAAYTYAWTGSPGGVSIEAFRGATQRYNRAVNGSAEYGTVVWGGGTVTVTTSTDRAHSGARSWKFVSNATVGQVAYFSSPGSPGVNTNVSFWHYIPAGVQVTLYCGVTATPTTQPASTLYVGTGAWQKFTLLEIPTSAYPYITIGIKTDSVAVTAYIDDIMFEEVVSASGTIAGMQGKSYASLQGSALGRMNGNERRIFTIRPKREITQRESYDLMRVISRLKPADSRAVIDYTGSTPYIESPLRNVISDSTDWEILSFVTPKAIPGSPYPVQSDVPVEMPRQPFTGYQGEAWSYLPSVIGIAAFYGINDGTVKAMPVERLATSNGTFLTYPSSNSLTPRRFLLAGRAASDGIITSNPYWSMSSDTNPDLSPLTIDQMDLTTLNTLLSTTPLDTLPQNPGQRFWATPSRPMEDQTPEIVEISLAAKSLVNYIYAEVAHYPHRLDVQFYLDGAWTTVTSRTITDSVPTSLPRGEASVATGHPQHSGPGHWVDQSINIPAVQASSVRLVLTRIEGIAPTVSASTSGAYSLAMRSVDIGYRVRSIDDVPAGNRDGTLPIGSTTDIIGSPVDYYYAEKSAKNLLQEGGVWRCDPQPISYSVVNLYLDVRNEDGTQNAINRFYMEPTHSGVSMSIYYANDIGGAASPSGAPRVNLAINPRAQASLSGWGYTNGTGGTASTAQITSAGPDGDATTMARTTITHADSGGYSGPYYRNQVSGSSGKTFTVSAWIRASEATDGVVAVEARKADGSIVGSHYSGDITATAGQWVRISGTVTSTATFDYLQIWFSSPDAGPSAASTVDMTQALIESGTTLGDFFDGSSQSTSTLNHSWNGATGSSSSTEQALTIGNPTEDWYSSLEWTPIQREYTTQKGYVFIPETLARHFKFEFTSLTPEPVETLLDITRTIKMFPQAMIDALASNTAGSDILPVGTATAMSLADMDQYADALTTLQSTVSDPTTYNPTDALYAINPLTQQVLQNQSWVYGFQPWFQGSVAPQWTGVQQHVYQEIEVTCRSKVAYFVGFSSLKAYTTDNGANDDTRVYTDYFNDFRHLQEGFTWEFDPGAMNSGEISGAVVQSTVYKSLHNINFIQFATQQTEATQIVPDDDIRNPALANIDWTNNDSGWHSVGDAYVVYSPQNHSARVARYLEPLERPVPHNGTLPAPIVHPVLAQDDYVPVFPYNPATAYGGIETPTIAVSEGADSVYLAVRVTYLNTPTSPAMVRLVTDDGLTVLGSFALNGTVGERIETYFKVPVNGNIAVRAQVVQFGTADNTFEVDTVSVFDVGIKWEFSVNGGTDWVLASDARNNANGVVNFPLPGNQLTWRATALRWNQSLSTIRIRPHYLGVQNARYNGSQHGPNVSTYDEAMPIDDDPLFNTWSQPVPRSWFVAYRQFPSLVSEDGPTSNEFSQYFGRPVEDDLPAVTDAVVTKKIFGRFGTEIDWGDGSPIDDHPTRMLWLFRSAGDSSALSTDVAQALIVPASSKGVVSPIVHPV